MKLTGMRAWLVGGGIVAALVFAVVWTFNHQHAQIAETERLLEAERIEKKGLTVAKQESEKGLQATIDALTRKSEGLAAALAFAQAQMPGATAVSAGSFSTGEIVVDAEPEESDGAPQEEAPEVHAGRVPVVQAVEAAGLEGSNQAERAPQASAGGVTPSSPSRPCVLYNGDKISIGVDEVTLKTAAGNYVPVGVATAYRESPGPRTKLGENSFQAKLSDASELAVPTLPRWGAGFSGVCFSAGCSAGPAVAFPPLRFTVFGHATQIETNAAGLIGGLGFGVGGTAIARF